MMTDQTTRGDQQKRSILPVSAKIELSPPDTHIVGSGDSIWSVLTRILSRKTDSQFTLEMKRN